MTNVVGRFRRVGGVARSGTGDGDDGTHGTNPAGAEGIRTIRTIVPLNRRRLFTAASLVLLASVGWPRQISAAGPGGGGSTTTAQIGPGAIWALAVDPDNPGTLYAGSGCYGVFKSVDGGNTWNPANSGLVSETCADRWGSQWACVGVRALAISTATPPALYAGTGQGMFVSLDHGNSWHRTELGNSVSGLVIDPTAPATLYAGTNGGVFGSTDSGINWSLLNSDLPECVLAIDPVTPTTLYAGAVGGGVFRSLNGARTWNAINNGLTNQYVYALAIDPLTPTTLYAGTNVTESVFLSLNGGNSWQSVGSGFNNVRALAIDPITPTTLYAGGNSGVDRSTNRGGTWTAVNTGLTNQSVLALAIDPAVPTTLYAGTWAGVFRSLNGGDSWQATGLGDVVCGDGFAACTFESCDDGNLIDGDGCDSNCTRTGCGNGIVTAGEECDDGDRYDGDGCDADCRREYCGDQIVQAGLGEECDDGNTIDGDGCDSTCRPTGCGSGVVTAGEECDDGNRNPFDGCTTDCTVCGNGIVTPPEECDDGSTSSGDSCGPQCRRPHVVGSGTPQSCSEAAFDTALGQGAVRFDCGPAPVTIAVTREKVIAADTSIDGGGLITLRGAGAVRLLRVEGGAHTDLRNLTLAGGFAPNGYPGGGGGGAIYNVGTSALTNCTLRDNTAGDQVAGGGVYNQGTLTLTHSTLYGNSAGNGGGISNWGTLTLTDCVLRGNSAQPGAGGGIHNLGTLSLTGCTVSDNSADSEYGSGGGISSWRTATLTVTDSTLSGNSAGNGGGIYIHNGKLRLTNSTLSGNSGGGLVNAPDCGGWGICDCQGPAHVINCTFWRNAAWGNEYNPFPAAIVSRCPTFLANTIIADSSEANCVSYLADGIVDGGHNLQFPGASCGATIPSLDPQLDPAGLRDNGGSTQTIALLPGSPAIDAGENASCPATDQRGVPRPSGASCDIGAYERTACGNGQTDPGEECDDGNLDPGDGCTNACTMCGNGVVTPPEQCDDGNTANDDACRNDCHSNLGCGDGVRNPTDEECDDGNSIDGDGCATNCRLEFCGDAILEPGLGEECDDGNLIDGDGCDVNCTVHHVVGNGAPGSCTETALDAALAGGGLVTFDCGDASVTITVTRTKFLGVNGWAHTVDGAGRVTLSGGHAVQVLSTWGSRVVLKNLTIADGSGADNAYGWYGGGITNHGTLTVTNCTFVGNRAVGFGGAILNQDRGRLTVVNSTFWGNTAPHGGAISCIRGGIAAVINSTVSGNSGIDDAHSNAGGIYSEGDGEARLRNTIVANNAGGQCNDDGVIIDDGHNLQWPGTRCGATIPSLDPRLDPAGLKDNGGLTQTVALRPGSPAIDAGDPEVCASPPVNGVDQRGFARPASRHTQCSIGAYEADATNCGGDCDGSGNVTIAELMTLVNVALGTTSIAECGSGDANGDNAITIDEILTAVNRALNGCGA